MPEEQATSTSESPVRKAELGFGGILIGIIFIAVVLSSLNYFNIIALPLNLPHQTQISATSFEALINKDITIKDITSSKITRGNFDLLNNPENVSDELQAQALEKLGIKIMSVGPHNIAKDPNSIDGNRLDDIQFGPVPGANQHPMQTFYTGYVVFGGMTEVSEGLFSKIGEELADKPIIPIPDSKDFYVYDDKRNIYVRIVRDKDSKYQQTLLNYFDLNNTQAFDSGLSPEKGQEPTELYKNRGKHMAGNLSDESLAIFFTPGKSMGSYVQTFAQGSSETVVLDENGIPIASIAYRIGLESITKIKELFK